MQNSVVCESNSILEPHLQGGSSSQQVTQILRCHFDPFQVTTGCSSAVAQGPFLTALSATLKAEGKVCPLMERTLGAPLPNADMGARRLHSQAYGILWICDVQILHLC